LPKRIDTVLNSDVRKDILGFYLKIWLFCKSRPEKSRLTLETITFEKGAFDLRRDALLNSDVERILGFSLKIGLFCKSRQEKSPVKVETIAFE